MHADSERYVGSLGASRQDTLGHDTRQEEVEARAQHCTSYESLSGCATIVPLSGHSCCRAQSGSLCGLLALLLSFLAEVVTYAEKAGTCQHFSAQWVILKGCRVGIADFCDSLFEHFAVVFFVLLYFFY